MTPKLKTFFTLKTDELRGQKIEVPFSHLGLRILQQVKSLTQSNPITMTTQTTYASMTHNTVEEEEVEIVYVEVFEVDGITYLKDIEDILYDRETEEIVGRWNGEEIEEYDEDEEEEEEQQPEPVEEEEEEDEEDEEEDEETKKWRVKLSPTNITPYTNHKAEPWGETMIDNEGLRFLLEAVIGQQKHPWSLKRNKYLDDITEQEVAKYIKENDQECYVVTFYEAEKELDLNNTWTFAIFKIEGLSLPIMKNEYNTSSGFALWMCGLDIRRYDEEDEDEE